MIDLIIVVPVDPVVSVVLPPLQVWIPVCDGNDDSDNDEDDADVDEDAADDDDVWSVDGWSVEPSFLGSFLSRLRIIS